MQTTLTCIVCPNGCELAIDYENQGGITVNSVSGNLCPKGEAYARQELISPTRTIATSVLVSGGTLPLVSVRINRPIPKARIFDVMNEIRALSLSAPVKAGDVLIPDVLGLGSDVIATKTVEALS